MATTDDEAANYDEFGMLKIYADYEGIAWKGQPHVTRRFFEVGAGQRMSALAWGHGEPELVFLHGGGQNAHTWDTVALALDRPLLAIDLPGHGHSDWREDRDYRGRTNARAVAEVIEQAAPGAEAVIGMSMGGLTNIALTAERPDLVQRAVIVDVTPGVVKRTPTMTKEQRGATLLIGGPPVFDSFDEMLQATAAAVPGRPLESLRTGVLHNSKRLDDGRWAWRYDRLHREGEEPLGHEDLWDDVATIKVPTMLVRGGRSAHVHDDDEAKMRELIPSLRVELVDGAGHAVQSDRPLVLAELITDFLAANQ